MPIAALFLIIAGGLGVAWLYPHLRWIALGVVVLFGGLAAALFLQTGNETEAAYTRISPVEVELLSEELVISPRTSELVGTVRNGAASGELQAFEVRVRLLDCPDANADPADCRAIGEDTGLARVDVPPGQVRDYTLPLRFPNMPAIQGVIIQQTEIVRVRALP